MQTAKIFMSTGGGFMSTIIKKVLLFLLLYTICFLCTACGSKSSSDNMEKTAEETHPYTEGKGSSCHAKLDQEGEQRYYFKMQDQDIFVIDLSEVQGNVDIHIYDEEEESLYTAENMSAGSTDENTKKIPVDKSGTYTVDLSVVKSGGAISIAIE